MNIITCSLPWYFNGFCWFERLSPVPCRWPALVDCVWNVMAHVQKPDFVFRRNGRVHLNRQGASVQSTTGSRVVRISGSNAGYTMFRGSVKGTGYPLHSPVSFSLPLPCVTVCHHVSTGLYSVRAERPSQYSDHATDWTNEQFRFSLHHRIQIITEIRAFASPLLVNWVLFRGR